MALRTALAAALVIAGAALSACGHEQGQTRASLSPGFGLFYNDQGATAVLAYGQANSDDVALMLQCRKGSGRVQVSDVARHPMAKGAPAPRLVLTSNGRRTELPARVETGQSDGPPILTADTALDGDALKAFRRSGRISVSFGDVRYGLTARTQERAGVERFFVACTRT